MATIKKFGAFAIVLGLAVHAHAEDYTSWVTLQASDDGSKTVSYLQSGSKKSNWSLGETHFPEKGKSYYVPSGFTLYTSSWDHDELFSGDTLALGGTLSSILYSTANVWIDDLRALSGGKIQFNAQASTGLKGAVTVEADAATPFALTTTVDPKSRSGRIVSAAFSGASGSGVKFTRKHSPVIATPDLYYAPTGDWSRYFGTLFVDANLEFLVLDETGTTTYPGTVSFADKTFLTSERTSGELLFGTLQVGGKLTLKLNFGFDGETAPIVVSGALELAEGAKVAVSFGSWYPKPGVQKYEILRLRGTAATSDVSADDFELNLVSPLWRDLPKTSNPEIAIDTEGDEKVISVCWPDEEDPLYGPDGANGLRFYGAGEACGQVDGIVDGSVSMSVKKEGVGTWRIGPNSGFTGGLDVKEGTLVIGHFNWEYYRWVIKQTFEPNVPDWDKGSSHRRVVGLKSFGLFDENGNDRVYCLSHDGDWTNGAGDFSPYYQSHPYSTPIQPGHFRITKYDGTTKIYQTTGNWIPDMCNAAMSNLFAHSNWPAPNFWCRSDQLHPDLSKESTWAVFTMRVKSGEPITSWDYVNDYCYDYESNQMISNCTLEASMTLSSDPADWTTLGEVSNDSRPNRYSWQGDGTTYQAGYATHTAGMPIAPCAQTPIAFAASPVSVAAGAVLSARTSTAPVITELVVDLEEGLGTIAGFALAESGVIRFNNAAGQRSFKVVADLSGLAGLDNLKGWTVYIDGKDKTGKVELTVSASGINVAAQGLIIIISGGPTTFSVTSPGEGVPVPLLSAKQKAFLQLSPTEICQVISNEVAGLVPQKEDQLVKIGSTPLPMTVSWPSGFGTVTVDVTKEGNSTPFFHDEVSDTSVKVWNLEVGTRYHVSLSAGEHKASRDFTTEDLAPRCIRLPGRNNTRDLGGRTLPNGKRIRQGLMYRTGHFADKTGAYVISEETRAYIVNTLGIRTDIDLRKDSEVNAFPGTGSPLGPTVEFIHEWSNYNAYSAVHDAGADATRIIFNYMRNPAKYPLVFHCAGGADRTGTVAFLVLGVLGASDDQIKMDYLLTSWAGFINGNEYPAWFNELVRSFDRYEGATLSARICTFFKTVLGFTEGDLDEIRAIMLEDPA